MLSPRERVAYSPVTGRPAIKWPNGERLALWVSPNIEHYEFTPPHTSAGRNPWPRVPAPDIQQYSYRDYGNRVGVWRMTDLCDEFDIRCTVSLNMAVMEHFPEIATLVGEHDWTVMSHGIYNTRYVYELSESEERDWLKDNIEMLRKHIGLPLKGMLGPAISGTARTPDLMAELGLTYHTDWSHDDQPVPIKTSSSNPLVSVPYSFELNDAPLFAKHYDGEYFEQICRRQFDVLYREGGESGRVMCIALHPFLIGQPHMIGHLRNVFEYIAGHDEVWMTTADDIADHYIANHYDAEVAYTDSLNEMTQ